MSTAAKRTVRYFVSYAHADEPLPEKLLTELRKQLGACKDYDFVPWRDTDLLIGEKWHEEIQSAVRDCDFGLLLVSPAFLGSSYIGKHELPDFVNGKKPCLPVAVCKMDFKNQDLKGLAENQIFRYQTGAGKKVRTFGECTGNLIEGFAHELFRQITERLGKIFSSDSTVAPASTHPSSGIRPSTPIPHYLPRLDHFHGREKELAQIRDSLRPEKRTWGALIAGAGGMGKTSLAVRAASEYTREQFNPVIFVSIKDRALEDEGPRAVSVRFVSHYLGILDEIARALGRDDIPRSTPEDRPRLILDALTGTRALLILDNLESLTPDDRERIVEFVSDLPGVCKAILTARRRIGKGINLIELDKLDEAAALATLADIAQHNKLLARASEDDRRTLWKVTGGIPLLLRWTAGQLGRGSCRTIPDAIAFLRSAPEGEAALEFIFGDLAKEITDDETKILCALTYFTLPAKVEHLSAIAGIEGKPADAALRSLANRSLVTDNAEGTHYALAPLVADFLRQIRPEVVKETGDRLEKRAYELILENGWRNHDRFFELEAAWPGIAPALALFLAGDNARLQNVCDALRVFLNFQGRWDEYLALYEKAEARAVAAADHDNAGWRASDVGYIHYLRQQADAVLTCADRAAAHWSMAKAGPRERAMAIRLQGMGHRLKKDYHAAITAYRESLNLRRSLAAESEDVAIGLNDLADAEQLYGDFAAAEEHYREALRVARAVGYAEGDAYITGNLAELALFHKDWPGAEALARAAMPLAEAVHRQQLIASNNRRLAKALVRQGKVTEALTHARRAVEIYTPLGTPDLAAAQATLDECELALAAGK